MAYKSLHALPPAPALSYYFSAISSPCARPSLAHLYTFPPSRNGLCDCPMRSSHVSFTVGFAWNFHGQFPRVM